MVSTAINPNNTTLSKSHLKLWLKMLRVSSNVTGIIRERLKSEFNTTLPRFDVMAALYRYQEGLKMSELSTVLRVSNGNVTGIIDRLEKEHLVTRHSIANDRRALIVKLTQQGKKEFSIQAKAHEEWVHELFSQVSFSHYQTLTDELDLILSQWTTE